MYFDDFKVEHVKSPIIQSQSYYPFGAEFDSFGRENSLLNQYKFNGGNELQDELDLNVLMADLRTYDPWGRLGWWQIDPKVDNFYDQSPYQFSFNNPIRYNDPKGDCPPGMDCQAAGEGIWNAVKGAASFVAETVQSGGQNIVEGVKNASAFAGLANAAPGYAAGLLEAGAKGSFVQGIKETGSVNGAASKVIGEVAGGIALGIVADKGLSKLGTALSSVSKVESASNVSAGVSTVTKTLQFDTPGHGAARFAERGITMKMAQTAINKGDKLFDPKNGTVNYVLKGGFASGKDLLIGTNPITGAIKTGIKGTDLVRPRMTPMQ